MKWLPLVLFAGGWIAGFLMGISRPGQKLAAKVNTRPNSDGNADHSQGDANRPAPVGGQPAPHREKYSC